MILSSHEAGTSSIVLWAWLAGVAAALTFVRIRVPSGYLSMSGIATSVAALTLDPRAAVITGLVAGLTDSVAISRNPVLVRIAQTAAVAAWTAVASWVGVLLHGVHAPAAAWQSGSVLSWIAANWLITATLGAIAFRMSPLSILRSNVNRQWLGAFVYAGISAIVIANLLDQTAHGYLLGTLTALLSLALADAVAGRQLKTALVAQLNDAERYLTYSRVVEGTIHNVRNFLSAALGHLNEHLEATGEQNPIGHVEIAREATEDAVEALNRLQAGSSPSVHWSADVDLSELAAAVLALVAERAVGKRVHLALHNAGRLLVPGDPGLLRQVLTNLVINAIDAVPMGGHVAIETGWRGALACVTVRDDGPGVAEKYRDRLFEPHFTTKVNGTGVGLFVSYGIVREHQGQLLYEGDRSGGAFTVLLAPRRSE